MILGIGFGGYVFATQPSTTTAQGLLTTTTPGSEVTGVAGRQVISLLNQLNVINFDTSLFKNPVYQSLQDFTVDVGAQGVGRANPFLPTGGTVIKNKAVNVPVVTLPAEVSPEPVAESVPVPEQTQ